ncbi:MAG: OmpA family protein, partial [Bacteroidota bacterium]
GDTYVSAANSPQVVNTGYATSAWSARLDLGLEFAVTDQLSLGLGAYYLRHFRVHPDVNLDLGPGGTLTVSHGENSYDDSVNPYTVSDAPPMVVAINPDRPICKDLASFGGTLSLAYRFGGANAGAKEGEKAECQTCPPDDAHKLLVTVRDGPTGQPLPETDVIVNNLDGQPVATGTTNAFGAVEFPDLPRGTYVVAGQLYGVATTTAPVAETDFGPGIIVRKDLFYEDLRFVLKGVAVNKADRSPEADVVAHLAIISGGSVRQDNTDPEGKFQFQLDAATEYEIVGSKRKRLSDIERVSTVGLRRSTTLFVELELGVDDFDCGQGTVLDIKYDLGSADLLPVARFELDRLVRYLTDYPSDRVELGSHTDSQGGTEFNQRLSERRAQSAVDYIVGKGISPNRIIAHGYGESRLLNGCTDGTPCSDEQHRVNRRTEAKLLCN